MCSLYNFPPLPGDDEIPLCEIERRVQYSTPDLMNLHLFTTSVADHPKVIITKDVLHHSVPKFFAGQVFLPGADSLIHKIQDAWYENGLKSVLQVLSEREDLIFPLRYLAINALYLYNLSKNFGNYIFSLREEEEPLEMDESCEPVVSVDWHPHCTKLAVATRDDTVTLFYSNSNLTPVLKAKAQRKITSVAWRPLTSGALAVACSEGVFVWNIDPNSPVTRPSFSSAVHLPHKYVTDISWSPQGNILMTCNNRDNKILAWEVDMKRYISLNGGGGVNLIRWSPDGSKLLAATVSKLLRVWTTSTWSYESWALGGNVSNACWSHDGNTLLFTISSDPRLYNLPSTSSTVFINEMKRPSAYMVADLTRVQLPSGHIVGGEVKGMSWDIKNKHLGVIFKDSPLIAIFLTRLEPPLKISPGFYIRGLPDELPSFICFQNNFVEGANLTIAWSNGRVQYFPMVYRNSQQAPTQQAECYISPNISNCSGYYFSMSSV